jgi:hypothetical protein
MARPRLAKQSTPDDGTSGMDGSCQASEWELAVIETPTPSEVQDLVTQGPVAPGL